MDPITLIVTALAAGAAAGLKPTAAQAIKDAYAGLKSLIVSRHGKAAPAVDQLEAAPASKGRRTVAEEELGHTEASRDADVLRRAQALLDAVQQHAPDAARTIGVDLQDIKAGSLKLADILARRSSGATGVSIRNAEVAGDISITGVTAGSGTGPTRPAPAPGPPRIKVLFLAANPTDTTRLRLDEEIRSIDESLRTARYRDAFDLEQGHAVRVDDLQGLLMRHDPHIVHFSGHGSESGEIILEDSVGRTQAVAVQALTTTFSLLKDKIRCVVLNACFSRSQAQAIAEHIDCVVGMSVAIGDAAAIHFAAAFYQALAYGRDVKAAFELGRNLIDLKGLGEQDTPQLLSPRADPAAVVFARH